MPEIRVLDEITINKIAAGEVIENTASVVKELVENSLDAGSTEICVEIKGGGRQLIRITDNGCGMSADNAVLSLERHATSKIRNVEDIHDVLTMGFRGEAIPSIASISKFTILTTPRKDQQDDKSCNGTIVSVEGGKILNCSPAVRSPGTTIEVKSLFFNIPVRKKFQKSPAYDTQEILKTLTILSLGYPQIKFELISDGKPVFNTPLLGEDHSFQEKLGFRIESILGKEFYESLRPFSFKRDEFELYGFVGSPAFHRQNKTGQFLFINNRAITSPLISYAIREGYGTALPSNRFPLFVAHLNMPGSLIDVNVHPQKKEVRIRQDYLLKKYVMEAVQKTIHASQQTNQFVREEYQPPSLHASSEYYEKLLTPPPSNKPSFDFSSTPSFSFSPSPSPSFTTTPIAEQRKGHFEEPIYQPFKKDINKFSYQKKEELPFEYIPKKIVPKIILILPGYIVLDPLTIPPLSDKPFEGVCLVDQKAAFTRIYYERLIHQDHQNQKHPISIQPFLIPITIEFSKLEASLLKNHLADLNGLGFNMDEFGESSFIINALPDFIKKDELNSFLLAIIEDMREYNESKKVQKEKEKFLVTSACRHASSYHKRLSDEEAKALIEQLFDCQTPFQCPLGKPTIAQISSKDLSQFFK